MAKITGLYIGTDGEARIEKLDSKRMLPRLYELIETDIVEAPSVRIAGADVDFWIDEEGKFRQPTNLVATQLWRACWGPGDYIAGNVVITGGPDQHGYSRSIPKRVLDALVRDGLEIGGRDDA
jgi:hypothetical protein